jgi:hypothetical protein
VGLTKGGWERIPYRPTDENARAASHDSEERNDVAKDGRQGEGADRSGPSSKTGRDPVPDGWVGRKKGVEGVREDDQGRATGEVDFGRGRLGDVARRGDAMGEVEARTLAASDQVGLRAFEFAM